MVCKCGAQNRRADTTVQALLKCFECGRIVVLYDIDTPPPKPKQYYPPTGKQTGHASRPKRSALGPPDDTEFYAGDVPPWDDSLSSEWE